jgi:membrane-bound lytic murein transglycosylase B
MMKHLLALVLIFLLTPPRFGRGNIPSITARQPEKFKRLHQMVRKNYSEAELRELLRSEDVSRMEEETDRALRFLMDPLTLKKQKARHDDAFDRRIRKVEIDKGIRFFEKHRGLFKEVHDRFRVHPADIISILNWESDLGRITGKQKVIQVFLGQYFLWEEYLSDFDKEGAFGKEGAMSRVEARERGRRLEKSALYNLAALLNQAASKNFDPAGIRGSRAGAIGYPQFMPASMRFALDGDGDGDIDLFSMPDAIYSVANYLARHKYRERGRAYSFKRYNPDNNYVRGVKKYSDLLRKAGVRI